MAPDPTSRIEWHYRAKSGCVIPTDALAVRVELAQGPAVMVQFRDIEREQKIERELGQPLAAAGNFLAGVHTSDTPRETFSEWHHGVCAGGMNYGEADAAWAEACEVPCGGTKRARRRYERTVAAVVAA